MADNVAITAGAGTSIAADDIASVWYQRTKLSLGADGTAVDAVAGAGVVGTGVQRVTLASDDPAVVDLAAIEVLLTNVAHDAADSGNPQKIGAVATASLNGGTNVAAADRTDLKACLDGALITRDGSLEDIVTATPIAITDGSSTSLIAAQGAGVKTYITDVTICNTSAVVVTVDLRDGAAGAVKWTFMVPAGAGVVFAFQKPLPFSANTAVCADPSAAATTITVSANGFKSKI